MAIITTKQVDGDAPVRRAWLARPARIGLVAVLLLTLVAPAAALSAVRLCGEPLDVSGTYDLPAWVRPVKESDAFAYPAHVAVASLLEAAGCSPSATAVQWLKAAAHARTPAEAAAAANGLRLARERGDLTSADDQRRLCTYVRLAAARPEQRAALAQADLRCG